MITDFYSSSLCQVFHSKLRKCYNCKKTSDDMMRCSQCKVFAFCSKECQLSAWKRVHKKQCRPLNPNTPREIDTWNNAFNEPDGLFPFILQFVDNESLDKLYNYILIKPKDGNIVNDIVGIEDDKDLLFFTTCPDEVIDDSRKSYSSSKLKEYLQAKHNICNTYKFPTEIQKVDVPGFSGDEYNEYNLCVYIDDNCRNSESSFNPSGDILLMNNNQERQGLRGNIILFAYKGHFNNPEIVPICRRDVYVLLQHIHACSAKGLVPERIHFANILKSELANWLQSSNFHIVNM